MISKASADQRKGRVGRKCPGVCYRLYDYDTLSNFGTPEIQSTDLCEIYVQLKKMGKDLETFPFIDKPSEEKIQYAKQLLINLEIIDSNGDFTSEGKEIVKLPVHPQLGRALYSSIKMNCTEEMTILAAFISCDEVSILEVGKGDTAASKYERFVNESGDHLTFINIFKEWQHQKQKKKWCSRHEINNRGLELVLEKYTLIKQSMQWNKFLDLAPNTAILSSDIMKCLLSGYFTNICCYADAFCMSGYYLYNTEQRLHIARGEDFIFCTYSQRAH